MRNQKRNLIFRHIFWWLFLAAAIVAFAVQFLGHPINGAELNAHPENVIQAVYREKGISLHDLKIEARFSSSHSRIFLFRTDQKQYAIHFERDLIFNRFRSGLSFEATPDHYQMELSDPILAYRADVRDGKITVYDKRPFLWQPVTAFFVFVALIASAIVERRRRKDVAG